MEPLLFVLLGTFLGASLAFPLARYQHSLELKRSQKRIAVKLAGLAVRTRREVYHQFIEVAKGHWIPDAVARQQRIVEQLDTLLALMEPLGGKMYEAALAARESLAANIATISFEFQGQPVNDPNIAIGDLSTSHMDLVGAATLMEEALRAIPDARARRAGKQLAEEVSLLRTAVREHAREKIQLIQEMDAEGQEKWMQRGDGLLGRAVRQR